MNENENKKKKKTGAVDNFEKNIEIWGCGSQLSGVLSSLWWRGAKTHLYTMPWVPQGSILGLILFYYTLMAYLMLSMLMILLSTLDVSGIWLVATTRIELKLLRLIRLVLLIWKYVSIVEEKPSFKMLGCWGCLSLLNWIGITLVDIHLQNFTIITGKHLLWSLF